ncbi:bacteriocin [Flavobacterium sp. LC2016-23]|nr:bacteriocin [Flavobacterium sp. LC2016-23]MRX38461.1 bacteriocin [Flavobacterium sp. LC2016-23]
MKILKLISEKAKTQSKSAKVFKPLTNQQLESVIGGPETSRGTETVVQHG